MKSIAIFGGTFNPVHSGHEYLLKEVCNIFEFEKIYVIPSKIPPHKEAKELCSGEERIEMCKLAFENFDKVKVSDFEMKREGKSYSYYTIRHFKKKYTDYKIYFIMGSDMLLSFHEWFRYKEILEMADIICLSRDRRINNEKLYNYIEKIIGQPDKVTIINVEPFEISSTEIRDLLKKRVDCSCYLKKNVVKYIMDRNLYQQKGAK